MIQSNIWNDFFRLYNQGLEDEYLHVMEQMPEDSKFTDPLIFTDIKNKVLNNIQQWYKRSFVELDNQSPEEMIHSLQEREEAMKVMKLSFSHCDDDIPVLLKIKLGSFRNSILDDMVELALEADWKDEATCEEEPSPILIQSSGALKLLGEWRTVQGLDQILSKFCQTRTPNEFISDAMKSYFMGLGELAVSPLIQALKCVIEGTVEFGIPYEFLLVDLTLIGTNDRNDEIFNCIRDCFRKMSHKIIGAICLGDYGDPRGIRVLKSYLDNHNDTIDKQTFYEVVSSIKRLNGDVGIEI